MIDTEEEEEKEEEEEEEEGNFDFENFNFENLGVGILPTPPNDSPDRDDSKKKEWPSNSVQNLIFDHFENFQNLVVFIKIILISFWV